MKSILVGFIGLALIAGCAPQAKQDSADSGRVAITVTEQGFEPATVTVAAGKPVTLVVTRQTTKTCATEVVMAAHGINQPLPLGQAVEITFTPTEPGELTYACAMDMYRGKIIVK
jgi:plastocyanin domain-containing protein